MVLLAYYDAAKRRIPVWLLGISIVVGVVFGILSDRLFSTLIGGTINLAFGLLIYLGGRIYARLKGKFDAQNPYFGFGDVYGVGILGFLFGVPFGFVALFFSFVLALIFAILEAGVIHIEFLKIRIRLGLCFLTSAVAINLLIIMKQLINN
jgi:hypothetical protein